MRPALASIPIAIDYLGKPSRSKFYADLLPLLDVVRFGNRTFVTIESLDRLIAANRRVARTLTNDDGAAPARTSVLEPTTTPPTNREGEADSTGRRHNARAPPND
jgi:hypothetical protein